MRRLARFALSGLLPGLLLLLLAPGVAAQTPGGLELRVGPMPTAPIKPEAETPAFPADVFVACSLLLAHVSPTAPNDPVAVPVSFALPDGATIVGPSEFRVDAAPCATGQQATGHEVFQVNIPRTAPGLTPLPGTGRASLGTQEAMAPFTVTADYFTVSDAKADALVRCSSCKHVALAVDLTNLGNARTQYTFTWGDAGPGGGWSAQLPEAVVLDSGATQRVEAFAHGRGGERALTLVAHPSAADDPSKEGDPIEVHFLVKDTSLIGKAAPMPGGAWLAVGLAGLALLSRRRA